MPRKDIFHAGIRDIMNRRKTFEENGKTFYFETTVYSEIEMENMKKHLDKSNFNYRFRTKKRFNRLVGWDLYLAEGPDK